MKDGKIEISLRDLILYVLVIALFVFVFLKFQVYQLELGLVQRHTTIEQSQRNIQILDQNVKDHENRIKRLEALNKAPTDTFVRE